MFQTIRHSTALILNKNLYRQLFDKSKEKLDFWEKAFETLSNKEMHLYLQMQTLAQLRRKSQMKEFFGISLIEPTKTNITLSIFLV